MPLAGAFIDCQKAFDSIIHQRILQALKDQGIEDVYLNILDKTYKTSKALIRLHKDTETFQLKKRVREGDTISPKLFTATFETNIQKIGLGREGIQHRWKHMNHPRFSDDIVLVAYNLPELQRIMKELDEENKAG